MSFNEKEILVDSLEYSNYVAFLPIKTTDKNKKIQEGIVGIFATITIATTPRYCISRKDLVETFPKDKVLDTYPVKYGS